MSDNHQIEALAAILIDATVEWRAREGYTGQPVHKPPYHRHLAAAILAAGYGPPATPPPLPSHELHQRLLPTP